MAYGLKFTVDFKSFQLRISQKDYFGDSEALEAASPAIIHAWETDNPIAPVRGSNITANLLGVSLEGFYSDNDDEYLGELYHGSNLLFKGLLVQDDCMEDVDDLLHPATLSFTDNLGLLKNMSFGDALQEKLTTNAEINIITSGFTLDVAIALKEGDSFTIFDNTSNLGTYTIAAVVSENNYTTSGPMPALNGVYRFSYKRLIEENRITLFAALQACIKATGVTLPVAIHATSLREDNQNAPQPFFEQTLISRETFLKSEREYEDCYTVLEKILSRFNASLVQAEGKWNIIRWFEFPAGSYQYNDNFARYEFFVYDRTRVSGFNQLLYPEYPYSKRKFRPFKTAKESFSYEQPRNLLKNKDFTEVGDVIRSYDLQLSLAANDGQNGVSATFPNVINIFTRETVPLNPGDTLNVFGTSFDGTYTVAKADRANGGLRIVVDEAVTNHGHESAVVTFYSVTVTEYVPLYWTANAISVPNEIFVRVITDSLNVEAERYLVIVKNETDISNTTAVFSTPVELSANDVFDFSFQFRISRKPIGTVPTAGSYAILTNGYYETPANNELGIFTTVPTLPIPPHYSVEWDGSFQSNPIGGPGGYGNTEDGGNSSKYSNADLTEWQSQGIRSRRAPVDGFLYLFLSDIAAFNHLADGEETHIKDLNFNLFFSINDRLNVSGHTHADSQNIAVKSSSETEIKIDDSPRSTVSGTLFLPLVAGSFQPKTRVWNGGKKLGQITTREIKQWRSKARTILEGTLHADEWGDIILSPLTNFQNVSFPNLNFVPGRMEIDYAERTCRSTLHELYEDGENDVLSSYAFDYLYNSQ